MPIASYIFSGNEHLVDKMKYSHLYFAKTVLAVKSAKILSLKNYSLYSRVLLSWVCSYGYMYVQCGEYCSSVVFINVVLQHQIQQLLAAQDDTGTRSHDPSDITSTTVDTSIQSSQQYSEYYHPQMILRIPDGL